MIYAVIDTNVIVSALLSRNPDSATVKVISAISENGLCPLYNQDILAEYDDVLNRSKFKFPPRAIDSILKMIIKTGISSERIHSDEVFPDEDDVVFYEVALSKDDAYLITGNKKHFPKNPIVVSPSEMLEILRGS